MIGGRFSLVACHRDGEQYIQDNVDLEKGVRGFLIDLYSDDGPLAREQSLLGSLNVTCVRHRCMNVSLQCDDHHHHHRSTSMMRCILMLSITSMSPRETMIGLVLE